MAMARQARSEAVSIGNVTEIQGLEIGIPRPYGLIPNAETGRIGPSELTFGRLTMREMVDSVAGRASRAIDPHISDIPRTILDMTDAEVEELRPASSRFQSIYDDNQSRLEFPVEVPNYEFLPTSRMVDALSVPASSAANLEGWNYCNPKRWMLKGPYPFYLSPARLGLLRSAMKTNWNLPRLSVESIQFVGRENGRAVIMLSNTTRGWIGGAQRSARTAQALFESGVSKEQVLGALILKVQEQAQVEAERLRTRATFSVRTPRHRGRGRQ